MKTPEQWIAWFDERSDCITCEGPSDYLLREFIVNVQSDAIRGAVDTIRNSNIYDGNLKQLGPALKMAKDLLKQRL